MFKTVKNLYLDRWADLDDEHFDDGDNNTKTTTNTTTETTGGKTHDDYKDNHKDNKKTTEETTTKITICSFFLQLSLDKQNICASIPTP